MSKNIIIQKNGDNYQFSGVEKIVTPLYGGNTEKWVPEDERQLGAITIHQNGIYDAADNELYAFHTATLDVPIKDASIDGTIGDIDLKPIIIIDPEGDIDVITIDDLDDFNIDPIDIIDIDVPVITIDEDGNVIDIIDEGDITIDDPIVATDGDGNIVVVTPEDLEDMGIDPSDVGEMDDPVVTIDPDTDEMNIVDMDDIDPGDLDGLDVLDPLDDGDIGIELPVDDLGNIIPGMADGYDCPDSIKINTMPSKTEYYDAQRISLNGMVVSAYYKDGSAVWANAKYKNGIIPLGELVVSQDSADYDSGTPSKYEVPEYSDEIDHIDNIGNANDAIGYALESAYEQIDNWESPDEERYNLHKESFEESVASIKSYLSQYEGNTFYIWSKELPDMGSGSGYTMNPVLIIHAFDPLPENPVIGQAYPCTVLEYRYWWSYTGENKYWGPWETRSSRTLFQGEKNSEISTINMEPGRGRTNTIDLSWNSPCGTIPLETSFDIVVNKDNTGTHHSGKF